MATVRLLDDVASSVAAPAVRLHEDAALADAGRAVVRLHGDAASSGAITATVRLHEDAASTDAPAALPTSSWRIGTDGTWHPLYANPL